MFSGIDGGNCILSSMAKVRVESGVIKTAQIIGSKGEYVISFDSNTQQWNGKPIVLSSSRQPYEPRIFRSIAKKISYNRYE